MANTLVIVESPTKAKTIKKYLGKEYHVLASYGHVRDLLPKEGAVRPDEDFSMIYQIIEKNAKHVEAIEKALPDVTTILLATDPDREGEAISYHIYELLKDKKLLKGKTIGRVVFHEITKNAILDAIQHPRALSEDLINAQQARRALDYLVGFNLSPLLWKKIRKGLSAGRVQSPALRMIVEREEEIEAFKTQEYWTIEADCDKEKQKFIAKLTHIKAVKLKTFDITTEEQAAKIKTAILKTAQGSLLVDKVEKKNRKRNPAPPFTTSTLQQEASRKLNFGTAKSMRVAQQLYEGINTEEGLVGLITYMRTDSVNLATSAIDDIRTMILQKYGPDYLPESPVFYKTKAKNAQEAHEAIRPTIISLNPKKLQAILTADQYKLYELIWKRTLACQMTPANIGTVSVDLTCPDHVFHATGSVVEFPGFLKAYEEGLDEPTSDGENTLLPVLKKGEKVPYHAIRTEQHFTEPPPRYSEASLVKTLEEYGIGRPSTYASIISTLQQRDYVTLETKRFHPTDVGRVVKKFLTQYFTQYVDYDFTAHLEDNLDAVSRGEKAWKPLLREFWDPFILLVRDVEKNVQRKDVTQEALDEQCPKCQKPLSVRLGKRGRFVGCSGFPDCDYTRSMDGEETSSEPQIVEGRQCPKCESPLQIRDGRYGKFIGCTAYPKCKHIEPMEKPADTSVECPECKKGTFLKRKSRYGKEFYSCSQYPDCKYAVWNLPLAQPCPKCAWPILTLKTTKRRGTEHVCPQKECGFSEPAP
jgi:DNA topoisomerase-1